MSCTMSHWILPERLRTPDFIIGGAMDIIIAGLIIAGLPGSAEWAIGLLVGLNLMFGGATLIGMALAARNS